MLIAGAASAQTYFPMEKGTVMEYKYYDGKGRPLRDIWKNERFLRFTVDEVWGDTVANVSIENEAVKRAIGFESLKQAVENINYGDVRVSADGSTFENMQWIFSQIPSMFNNLNENRKEKEGDMYSGAELSATSYLPRELHVGDSLREERFRALYIHNGSEDVADQMENLNEQLAEAGLSLRFPGKFDLEVTAVIRNRRVDALERVTVPAGEWECWKISYEVVGPTEGIIGMPSQEEMFSEGLHAEIGGINSTPSINKYVDYISPEVGLVKREKFNYRGNKVEETVVLESVKK